MDDDFIKKIFSDYNSQCDSLKSGLEGSLEQVVLSAAQLFHIKCPCEFLSYSDFNFLYSRCLF